MTSRCTRRGFAAMALSLVGACSTAQPLGIGFRHDQAELQAAVNRALADMRRDGSRARLAEKWGVP